MSSPSYQELAWMSQEQQTQQPQLQFVEQEEPVRSPWKSLAALSSHLLLIGYLLIPLAFGDDAKNVSKIIAASVLIGFADTLALILVCFQHDESAYLIHSIFLPGLSSNLLGLLNVVLNILCRGLLPIGQVEAASLGLASAFVFLHIIGALWVYGREVAADTRVERPDKEIALLSEDEMQRQQLMRLLQEKGKSPSPRVMQKTFRVQVPERINPGKGWDSFMPPPREEGLFGR